MCQTDESFSIYSHYNLKSFPIYYQLIALIHKQAKIAVKTLVFKNLMKSLNDRKRFNAE